MRSTFDQALLLVLKHEGGFVNHPDDPGGMTCLGVTKAVWDAHTGRSCTEAEMRALTPEAVQPVYRAKYWHMIGADRLPVGMDYCMFDCAVNSGPARAIKTLQYVTHCKVDGILGPVTMTALARANGIDLIEDYNQRRLDFLKSLAIWPIFGAGWARRVSEVETEAKALFRTASAPEQSSIS